MRTIPVVAAALLCMAAAPTVTSALPPGVDPVTGARPGNVIGTGSSLPISDRASNINAYNTHSEIAPRLPSPAVSSDDPDAYLRAARQALTVGRTGEAQEALEEAEARLLDRSVPIGRANIPDQSPMIRRIDDALQALAAGNLVEAQRLTDKAELAAAEQPSPDQVEASSGPDVTGSVTEPDF